MKSVTEMQKNVLEVITKINNTYPELLRNLEETALKNVDDLSDGVNIKNMQEYYNSLLQITEKYTKVLDSKADNC